MTAILNEHSEEGWDLAQLLFGQDGVLAVWKWSLERGGSGKEGLVWVKQQSSSIEHPAK